MAHLTEPEAWRLLAQRLIEREEEQALGLCYMTNKLYNRNLVTNEIYRRMYTRLVSYLPHVGAWAYPWRTVCMNVARVERYREKYREPRALAALWLALEAEEELT